MAIENLQPLTYVIISIAFAIGISSTFLRLYCRFSLLEAFGVDDVVAIFLLLVNTMQQTILYMFLHYGCGKHYTLLSPSQLENITKWLLIEEIFYMFTHWTIKQAFLSFYLRLSPDKIFQRCVYGAMVLNTAFTIVNWLLALLQCRPFDAILHPANHPNAKCIDTYVVLMLPSILNIITDLIILTLPIKTVLSLQMSTRRKIAVLSVICFGACAVIVALCRFIILKQLATSPDTSYVLGRMIIVAALEIEVAVVAVNLPGMKSLFTRISGSSKDNSASYPPGDSYNMGGYKRTGSSGKKSRKTSLLSISHQRSQHTPGELGATLTGSEEELLRREGGNIKITTNVQVTPMQGNRGGSAPNRDVELYPGSI